MLGDIHAEDQRLASALTCFEEEGVDLVLSVGDIADGHGDLERTVSLLIEHEVSCIRGNHDRWLLANEVGIFPGGHVFAGLSVRSQAFFRALPTTRELDSVAGKVLICHGVGENDMRKLKPSYEGYELECSDELQALIAARRYALVIGGHTHERMARRFGDLVFVNPGTLHREYPTGFVILDLEARVMQPFDFIDATRFDRGEMWALP